MISCRIYFFTYKRDYLLPRAIQSLISQTFKNWICEVHNDCPGNSYPADYILSLNDPRFVIKDHAENLGPVASFNLAFAGCAETYASILEDDNWWEPEFLSEMIGVMQARPQLNILWSNMRLWQEKSGNNWEDTGRTTWPVTDGVTFFPWPRPRQALSGLHATGAMLYKGMHANNYAVPPGLLINAVELIRERSFEHPIALLGKPLANFAITISTVRSADPYQWIAVQIMLLASFVVTSPNPELAFKESLVFNRTQKPTPVANFFLANILVQKNNRLYKYFNCSDWLTIVRWLLRNGHRLQHLKKYLATQKETYLFLLTQTKARYNA